MQTIDRQQHSFATAEELFLKQSNFYEMEDSSFQGPILLA